MLLFLKEKHRWEAVFSVKRKSLSESSYTASSFPSIMPSLPSLSKCLATPERVLHAVLDI
jgi:hypothetical protein